MNQSPEYQSGIEVERQIIKILGLTESSLIDNIFNDIDAWWPDGGMSYSIKCQHTALRTGNLAFELDTEDRYGDLKRSWFYTGQADQYLIVVGDRMYRIDRKALKAYITDKGWCRVCSLKPATQQSQRDIGHPHVNAHVGLISIKRRQKDGLIISEDNVRFLTQCS
jgi:hypothetical protein